jgi:hypothetical protein
MVLSFGCALRDGASAEKLRAESRITPSGDGRYSLTATLKLG